MNISILLLNVTKKEPSKIIDGSLKVFEKLEIRFRDKCNHIIKQHL